MTLKGLPELARGDAAKGLRGLAVSRGELSWLGAVSHTVAQMAKRITKQ